jgi:hypothetical protein
MKCQDACILAHLPFFETFKTEKMETKENY